jgi:hypothetical protein
MIGPKLGLVMGQLQEQAICEWEFQRFEHGMNLQKINKIHTSYTHYTELLGVM